ncbi:LytTR family DNA-binding domain-containing protein [Litorimonas sp. WD9-15]|uniref:LytTR family DNA-binding domain-containing protein n=1 Tax=Litorimonas sp. WD9-15 TaxID=3418716 RepID=UPI003D091F7B
MPQVSIHHILKGLLTPLLAGVVLAILAPFGTSSFSVAFRLIYWIGLTLAGGLGAMGAHFILSRKAPATSVLIWAGLQSAGATLAVAPFVFNLHTHSGFGPILTTLFYIWVVAIVITAFGQLAGRRHISTEPEPSRPALLDRLPASFRDATLYAISSEDHYVRIHSAAGEHMLLMRLTDAEDLAAPLVGLKPHRSWWVAEAGVESVTKSSGKTIIQIKSGTVVPVSREGAKRVREAGWI